MVDAANIILKDRSVANEPFLWFRVRNSYERVVPGEAFVSPSGVVRARIVASFLPWERWTHRTVQILRYVCHDLCRSFSVVTPSIPLDSLPSPPGLRCRYLSVVTP